MRGDLIETHKVLSKRESIDWVKPLNLRKNVNISGPALNVRGNSLSMQRLIPRTVFSCLFQIGATLFRKKFASQLLNGNSCYYYATKELKSNIEIKSPFKDKI